MATAVIDCDFDSHANFSGAESETGTTVTVGNVSSVTHRPQFRFPLSGITAGSTINDSDFQFNVVTNNGMDLADSFNARDYGTSDPDTDNAATKFANSANTSPLYTGGLVFNTTGSKTHDLGTTADTDIAARLSSPGWLTIAIQGVSDGTENALIEAIENAGTDPATLTVDYTEPSGATLTIVSLVDEVSASLSVNQSYLTTTTSTIDEVSAVLNVNQSYPMTVASTIDEVTCSITLSSGYTANINSTVDEVAASLNAVMHPQITIASSIDEVSAALAVNQTDYITINSTVDEIAASLNAYLAAGPNINSTIDEVSASLNAEQRYLVTIASVVEEVYGSFFIEMRAPVTIAATLDEVSALLNISAANFMTIQALIDEVAADLNVLYVFVDPPPEPPFVGHTPTGGVINSPYRYLRKLPEYKSTARAARGPRSPRGSRGGFYG